MIIFVLPKSVLITVNNTTKETVLTDPLANILNGCEHEFIKVENGGSILRYEVKSSIDQAKILLIIDH